MIGSLVLMDLRYCSCSAAELRLFYLTSRSIGNPDIRAYLLYEPAKFTPVGTLACSLEPLSWKFVIPVTHYSGYDSAFPA